MDYTIRKQLMNLAEPGYQKFSASLLPNVHSILGVRLPALRKIAKQLAKEDWRGYLKTADSEYFEEVMLQGMVIGYAKADIEEILRYAANFIPKIDNWSVCDSFCNGLKMTKERREIVLEFIKPYLTSPNEYEVRFGVVMLLNWFVVPEYIHRLFPLFDSICHEGYYAKMAVAWAISICFIHFPQQTLYYLKNNRLDDFTYNKALQKITESLRIEEPTKKLIRSMKRK